jgi:hypothetical protein
MSSSIKKSSAYFTTDNQDLSFIFTKVKKLADINQCVLPLLPAYIREDCQVANITDKVLILMTDKASVFSQLRFMNNELLSKIKQLSLCSHVKEIQFKIRPSPISPNIDPPLRKISLLSPDTADIIRQAAESIEDPVLQTIMQRIAERRKK